ncbi:hypothetical protein DL96DRAFT_1719125 [Flagelloscypha sp. PMI_526]|nr:hypothetical protein DL96DRAFT_1719125 [Flagelloscypha sp. PMI_526]
MVRLITPDFEPDQCDSIGFLTVATFAALRILSKQSTSSTRNLSIIIIVQWIVKTIASIVGLISICSFYSSTRYVIEHDELVLQSNAVIGKSRRLFSGSTDILWTINVEFIFPVATITSSSFAGSARLTCCDLASILSIST